MPQQIHTDLFKYKYIPAKQTSEKLMIVLHGRGDSIRPFRSFHDELKISGMNYLLLNAPRKFLDGYSWYGEPPFLSQGVARIRQKLMQLLNDLEAQGWKSENIVLFGFSQGCLVSADLALNYPKRLGGVIGISGYFHFNSRWRNRLSSEALQTPWLFTHGRRDDILKIDETKFGARKLQQAGFKVKFVETNKKHVLEEEEYPVIRRWVKSVLFEQNSYR